MKIKAVLDTNRIYISLLFQFFWFVCKLFVIMRVCFCGNFGLFVDYYVVRYYIVFAVM